MTRILIFLFVVIFYLSCNNINQQISISAVDLYDLNSNQLQDTLDYILKEVKPDIFSFNCRFLSEDCSTSIVENNFEIFDLYNVETIKSDNQSLILSKINLFTLQSSGQVVFSDSILNESSNSLNWLKLKDSKYGYIFFVYNLLVQSNLTEKEVKVLGSKILKKIDETSAGAPVILITDLKNNIILNNFLIQKWNGLYTLHEVKNIKGENTTFYINDYFVVKIQGNMKDKSNLYNELKFKFTMKIKKISKNVDGKDLF